MIIDMYRVDDSDTGSTYIIGGSTSGLARKALADWTREEWQNLELDGEPPEDDEECIKEYFVLMSNYQDATHFVLCVDGIGPARAGQLAKMLSMGLVEHVRQALEDVAKAGGEECLLGK